MAVALFVPPAKTKDVAKTAAVDARPSCLVSYATLWYLYFVIWKPLKVEHEN